MPAIGAAAALGGLALLSSLAKKKQQPPQNEGLTDQQLRDIGMEPGKVTGVTQADYERAMAHQGGQTHSQAYNPPPASGPLAGEKEAVTGLAEAGEEHVREEREVVAANKAAAEAELEEMKAGRRGAAGKLDEADVRAEEGLTEVRETIEATREGVAKMPEKVQAEFDRRQEKIDAGLEQARTGLAEYRTEALGDVMQGQSMAMEAAVQGIHGGIRQQVSQIDAQVQQGIISPSQATMMKSQIRMGGAMQLSAAVGQTAHLFTQTQAEVANSFGTMFTNFESNAAQVQGQFGATAGSVFGQAQVAASQFNTALTGMDAQATAHRNTALSQNATTRSTAQYMNDQVTIGIMDYTQDTYVSGYPMAINNLQAEHMLAGDIIKLDEMKAVIELMEENKDLVEQGTFWQMLLEGGRMAFSVLG